jgi:hypothetical protein
MPFQAFCAIHFYPARSYKCRFTLTNQGWAKEQATVLAVVEHNDKAAPFSTVFITVALPGPTTDPSKRVACAFVNCTLIGSRTSPTSQTSKPQIASDWQSGGSG